MTDHKAVAEALALVLADNAAPPPADAASMIAVAQAITAHALLALVEQVGALVEQQRVGNTIAAFPSRAVRSDEDYATALATVRGLLGLTTEESENR